MPDIFVTNDLLDNDPNDDEPGDDDKKKPNDDEPGDDDKKKPGDNEKKLDDDDPLKNLQAQVTKLEGDKRNLNTALHQARQDKKTKKADAEPGEQLTNDQIEDLIKDHADDPKVMANIIGYIAEQSAKNQVTVSEVAQLKKETDAYMATRWPDIVDENSALHQRVTASRKALNIENHPMADYLAVSALICEELPQLQKEAYDRGTKEALGKKGEKNRKKNVKENILSPKGSGGDDDPGNLTSSMNSTVKQMGLSKSQRKIYSRIIGDKKNEN